MKPNKTIKAFSGKEITPARFFLASRPRFYLKQEQEKKTVWIPSGREIRI